MNAYMRWTDGGKTFVCNFCGHNNPCPEQYFSYLGPDGRRRDVYERPELCRGSYEVMATKEYFVRPPMPVTHVFLIDVSSTAVASGATAATCLCIEQVLDSLQGGAVQHTSHLCLDIGSSVCISIALYTMHLLVDTFSTTCVICLECLP